MARRIRVPERIVLHIHVLVQRLWIADIGVCEDRVGLDVLARERVHDLALELIWRGEPTLRSRVISGKEVVQPRLHIPLFAGKLLRHAVGQRQRAGRVVRRGAGSQRGRDLFAKGQVVRQGLNPGVAVRDHARRAQRVRRQVAGRAGLRRRQRGVLRRQLALRVIDVNRRRGSRGLLHPAPVSIISVRRGHASNGAGQQAVLGIIGIRGAVDRGQVARSRRHSVVVHDPEAVVRQPVVSGVDPALARRRGLVSQARGGPACQPHVAVLIIAKRAAPGGRAFAGRGQAIHVVI